MCRYDLEAVGLFDPQLEVGRNEMEDWETGVNSETPSVRNRLSPSPNRELTGKLITLLPSQPGARTRPE